MRRDRSLLKEVAIAVAGAVAVLFVLGIAWWFIAGDEVVRWW